MVQAEMSIRESNPPAADAGPWAEELSEILKSYPSEKR
jgi:hypothetical protein